MKKISKICLFNIILTITILLSFIMTIRIDNASRLLENINTDYHMNSLPYIYLILVCLIVLIVFNIYHCVKSIKKVNN